MLARSSTFRAAHKSIQCIVRDLSSSSSCPIADRSIHSPSTYKQGQLDPSHHPSRPLLLKPSTKVVKEAKEHRKPIRLLHPHVLSGRLTKLADEDKLDEAVHMLQNAPQDACNVSTWNTVIWQCMKTSRFRLAYKLFIDMKRRGFRPNTRTYVTMLSGLSRIEDFSFHSVQLQRAHSLYESFVKYVGAIKKIDPNHDGITSSVAGFYIQILSSVGEYNKMFDVFNALDEDGPFSASAFVYSSMFTAIADRQKLPPGDTEIVRYRNASDAKLLWKQMLKAYERSPDVMSSHAISMCLRAIARGLPADQLYAFDIIKEFLGLAKPGETAPPPKVQLSASSLDAILALCLTLQRYRLCTHYYQQVIDKHLIKGEELIIYYHQVEKVLQAYAHMTTVGSLSESNQAVEIIEWMHKQVAAKQNAEQIRPRRSTYTWALMACWRGGDWASAVRILELMSGCHAEDFTDENRGKRPTLDARSEGLNIRPDASGMSCVVRAALTSGDLHNMRQCLRILTYFGEWLDGSWMREYLGGGILPETASARERNNAEYYRPKMVSTLDDLLGKVLKNVGEDDQNEEVKAWRALRATTKNILRSAPRQYTTTPIIEEDPIGSISGLAATAEYVEYDMAKRTTKSRTIRK